LSGTVIFCSASVTVTSSQNLVEGRLQALNLKYSNQDYLVLNIHMPHNIQSIKTVIELLEQQIEENKNIKIIMSGDWNYVDDVILDSKNRRTNSNFLKNTMQRIMAKYNLIDCFRHLHPTKAEFTHCGNQLHKPVARLDRIYVNTLNTAQLKLADNLPSFSDHKITRIALNTQTSNGFKRFILDNQIIPNASFILSCENILEEFIISQNKNFKSYELLKWDL